MHREGENLIKSEQELAILGEPKAVPMTEAQVVYRHIQAKLKERTDAYHEASTYPQSGLRAQSATFLPEISVLQGALHDVAREIRVDFEMSDFDAGLEDVLR